MNHAQAFDAATWRQRREAIRQTARALIANLGDMEKKLVAEWQLNSAELAPLSASEEEPVNLLIRAATEALDRSQHVKARIRDLEAAEAAERQRLAEEQRLQAEREALANARAKAVQMRLITAAVIVTIIVLIVFWLNSRG